jgi:Protein of unknown function (DUF1566)
VWKIMSRSAMVAVLFALSNIVIGSANGQTENLKSWSRKIDNARNRFETLTRFDNEAVLDRETQLVWEREPQDPFLPGTFTVAVDDCYNRIVGGRMGWRLPTLEELTSLLVETPTTNPQVVRAALPDGHPFIGIRSGDRPESAYWSITAGSNTFGEGRFTVAVDEPEVSTVVLETDLEIVHPNWCVRGPGGGQSSREP